ncbi:hypothetical protein BDV38DRAFT_279544 [Aspergillus pseudotamarii]|uniref:Hydrophobic surface binding protein A-domain-containing protein n=1 Tax=Aspergillus pseudotamarii TaxID=132259 RepID=A0A5N6T464_ASPPS|nr:uncharacterized protein BDV38DRAFT_279544 [Aspergillus pseudotamarii]KAE8141095.1 hypothetical protein BDV38DRAFT_279544 [Aspergillus pseudotamarii]
MKFTGLVASLAAVSAASAAAIPTASLQPTLNQLNGVLGNIDGVLGGALCDTNGSGLVEVQDALKQIQSDLSKLTGTVSQRSVVSNEVDTVDNVVSPVASTASGAVQPVVGTVNSAVGTVKGTVDSTLPGITSAVGVKRQVGQLGGVATSLVGQIKDGTLTDAAVEHILESIQAGNLPLVGNILGAL